MPPTTGQVPPPRLEDASSETCDTSSSYVTKCPLNAIVLNFSVSKAPAQTMRMMMGLYSCTSPIAETGRIGKGEG